MTEGPEGLVILQSRSDAAETFERLVRAVQSGGMTIFARIDQAGAAMAAGLALRPTFVLLFGNPKAGTPLMQAAPSIAIDLPLKALVWGEAEGAAQLAYVDPVWLARRHGLDPDRYPVVHAMAQAITAVAADAVS
jgi:uncharacterized protein (DUF302 family)